MFRRPRCATTALALALMAGLAGCNANPGAPVVPTVPTNADTGKPPADRDPDRPVNRPGKPLLGIE